MTRAAPPIFPFPGHRTLGEVIADEAIMQRRRDRMQERQRRSAAA